MLTLVHLRCSVQILEEFEMKILETLRCESQYHCKVGMELDKLHEKQKVLCDILRNKQHNEMMKVLFLLSSLGYVHL